VALSRVLRHAVKGLGVFPAVSLIKGCPGLWIRQAQTLRASQHRASMDFPQQPIPAAAITQTLFTMLTHYIKQKWNLQAAIYSGA